MEFHGVEKLRNSFASDASVLIAPNHCRPCDPLIINELCVQAGKFPFTMASWHLFIESRLQRFVLRRIGAFSVYREGLDRQALNAGVQILSEGKRPLVIFPEGVITRTNDRLLALMDGVSFVARSAAKKRAKQSPNKKVVIHPVAIRYVYEGDLEKTLHDTLDDIEQRLSWSPKRESDLTARIYRVGEALLWLKEIEFFGRPQAGEVFPRLERLINGILDPLEHEWLSGRSGEHTVARVKHLRTAILRDMIGGELGSDERSRRWKQLADIYLAQQLSHYAPDYIRSNPTKERLLETVERFEEDLTDHARIHGCMSATVSVGDPIEVAPKREKGSGEDPVMVELDRQLRDLLGISFAVDGD
ncbi:1-acyl-sn-glycerol-3-phosphate acyltransferase [Rubripirellula sp.]|nr:1-acyl-sn-glycerol-3-phosphate acyltransferase [Rubripirellula sp.]MDB4338537.1 1-acyl-sn-glycerol-3-phosphate acyltransferase [Rubripirellula sp.]